MRILIEPSTHSFLNIGDTAMLQVAVARLNSMWPNAYIQILTEAPELLSVYCPNAIPITTPGQRAWVTNGYLLGRLHELLPRGLAKRVLRIEKYLRHHYPELVASIIRYRMKGAKIDNRDLNGFLEAVSKADVVILTGGGGITDSFEWYATTTMATFNLAIKWGKMTAMFGQGIGPIENPELQAQAKTILPAVDLICLRENRAGKPLLASLGVTSERVLTTGDDAIELAYQLRTEKLSGGLGVNLRAASYSRVDQHLIKQLRPILQNAAGIYKAPLIPIPISHVHGEEDIITIRQLIVEHDQEANGGQELNSPLKVIEQIQRCRVVVTGSYHAAVFALAQGIPAVSLVNSNYYADKFLGLAEQFGKAGCEVIFLADAQWSEKLADAISRMWQSAEHLKPQLLETAACQVEVGRAAYKRLYELVSI